MTEIPGEMGICTACGREDWIHNRICYWCAMARWVAKAALGVESDAKQAAVNQFEAIRSGQGQTIS